MKKGHSLRAYPGRDVSKLGYRPAPNLAFQLSSPETRNAVLEALEEIQDRLWGVHDRDVFGHWLQRRLVVHPERLEHKVPFAVAAHSPCQHAPHYMDALRGTVKGTDLPDYRIAFVDGAFRHLACGEAVSPVVSSQFFPCGSMIGVAESNQEYDEKRDLRALEYHRDLQLDDSLPMEVRLGAHHHLLQDFYMAGMPLERVIIAWEALN